jgi:hypothetical protein|tara:strand:+ start:144 stop:344 length:201 start_codon:yes stop_codon:yes gene_type:complete
MVYENGLCFFLWIFFTASLAVVGVIVLVASIVAVFYFENCTVDLLIDAGIAASLGSPTVVWLILGI